MAPLGTKFKTYNKLIGADSMQDGFLIGSPYHFAPLKPISPLFCSYRAKPSKTTPPIYHQGSKQLFA